MVIRLQDRSGNNVLTRNLEDVDADGAPGVATHRGRTFRLACQQSGRWNRTYVESEVLKLPA